MAYPGSSDQLWCQCSCRISAGAGVGRGSLKQPTIACFMTLGLSQGMNGVTLPIVLWGLSDPTIAELREMPRSFSIKLHSETQDSSRLGMSWGRSPRHAQNPLSGERRKTLSITHHALSPPPSHHHLYIIHIINWLQRFIVLQCHLNDHLCRKVT